MKHGKIFASVAVLGALALAAPASAAVILDDNPFQAPDPTPQIHNTGNQSGTTVTGITVGGGYLYNFTSPSTLMINGAGHATIEGPWHTLTMTPADSGNSFSSIDFNLNVAGVNRNNPFYADILLNLVGGGSQLFHNVSLGNGQNKYLIYGTAGETFSSISFTGWLDTANTISGNFVDIRQIDVQTITGAVPEPASWALMIAGFGLVGAAARRRQAVRVTYA